MRKIIIDTPESASAILIGGRWEAVVKLLPSRGAVIITDENVSRLYGSRFPSLPVLKIKPGEDSKSLKVIEHLSSELVRRGIDRTGFILGIGGGVVCDVTGFLASVYFRGVKCGYVSTSLLSQVDASTGGKTGVNLGIIKNVIGTFSQPEFVVCDTTMLRSLPEDEFLSGLAELIKTGLIGNKHIVDILEREYTSVIKRDRILMSDLVYKSVLFKASVVAKDEKESGLRRILNFGHTFGHAVELHNKLKHGFAVAAGMEIASAYSVEKGFLKQKDHNRIIELLNLYNLRSSFTIPSGKMERLVLHDKKKSGDEISFVFLRSIGKTEVQRVKVSEIIEFYRKYKSRNSK